jgi:cell division protein FtsL
MDINAKTKKRQDEISAIQSDIDGLEIQKSELASFSRLKKVATAKGYTYKQGSTAAVVVSEDK